MYLNINKIKKWCNKNVVVVVASNCVVSVSVATNKQECETQTSSCLDTKLYKDNTSTTSR